MSVRDLGVAVLRDAVARLLVLAGFEQDDGQPAVLADGDAFLGCDLVVAYQRSG